jgi:hypothetical protein
VLTGPPTGSNSPNTTDADLIVPVTSNFTVAGNMVNFTAPAFSVIVLSVVAN